jgi:ferrous-iron efflux pump FieF
MVPVDFNSYSKLWKWFDRSSPLYSTRISLLACVIFAPTGILFGTLGKSLAVQANGLLWAIDIFNTILFLAAVQQSIKIPDSIYNYGYGKYEALSTLISLFLGLIVLGFVIFEIVFQPLTASNSINKYILLCFALLSFLIIKSISKAQKGASEKYLVQMFNNDARLWKMDSFIELAIITNLIAGIILEAYKFDNYALYIDNTTAAGLILFSIKNPLRLIRNAINQLLDRTVPETIQFDIIAVIAENINRFCEFKNLHSRQSGKDIFIEIDVVLPYDFTLATAHRLEKEIGDNIKEKYPNAIPRLYAVPCDKDCIHSSYRNCPVKLAISNNEKE